MISVIPKLFSVLVEWTEDRLLSLTTGANCSVAKSMGSNCSVAESIGSNYIVADSMRSNYSVADAIAESQRL